jgi:hypothetical protein
VVVQRAYDLALWIVRKVAAFPRSHRFTLGDRLILRSLDVLEDLVQAAYARDKELLLEQAVRNINSLRFLLRMALDLELISRDSHEFCSTGLEEIGRMTGGWRRALRK